MVSCPEFDGNKGRFQVYARNSTTNQVQLIYQETGNNTNAFFNVGQTIDLKEQNWNHAQLFYTSTLRSNALNKAEYRTYTHINTLDIIRFRHRTRVFYKFRNTVSHFRDRSNDTLDLGRIDFSIYNQSLLLTVENQSPSIIKYLPVCPYNHSYDSYLKRCYTCPNQ